MERTTMSIGSLFDGSGTAPLAATILGWTPLWASEIEPYPVAVTRARFPNMIHLGDIAQINGAEVVPVDVIVGGSPCQDLSVAGKQAGLQDGSRSHLFYQMTRIVREMRAATNGKYPRFVVWENVPGAFSSNKGRDFHAVVAEFCAIADSTVSIPEPERNKTGRLVWRNAGTIVGDGWSFGWRVLDAQYWGVPQRRRRIFAVLDLGSERAGEILFERARLPWDSEPRGAEGEGAPADAVGRADRGGGVRCLNPWDCQSKRIFEIDGIYPTLPAMDGGGANNQAVIYPAGVVGSLCARADSSPCVDRGQPFVAMFSGGQGEKAGSIGYSEPADAVGRADRGGGVRCLNPWDAQTMRVYDANGIYPALFANTGGGQNRQAVIYPADAMGRVDRGGGVGVTHPEVWHTMTAISARCVESAQQPNCVVYALQGNGIDRAETAGCNGRGWNDETMYTLNTIDKPAVVFAQNQRDEVRDLGDVAGALNASPGMKQQTYVAYAADCRNGALSEEISGTLQAKPNGGQSLNCVNPVVYDARGNGDGNVAATLTGDHQNRVTDYTNIAVEKRRRYVVRRLTPTECARLQGFPDWWCDDIAVTNPTEDDIAFWACVWETYRKATSPSSKPKTRNQIVKWLRNPGSDSNEYKMWGNGMALPCMLAVLNGIDSHVRFFLRSDSNNGESGV